MAASPRTQEFDVSGKKKLAVTFGTFTLLSSIFAFVIILVNITGDTPKIGGGVGDRNSAIPPNKNAKYFNWHPLLMSITFLLCLPLGISSFELYPVLRNTNKWIHSVFNTLGVISATSGFYIIVDLHKNLRYKGDEHVHGSNCTSIHGIAGYFTYIVLVLVYLAGFVLYTLKLGGEWRGTLKPLHKRFGFFVYLSGLGTLCMGLVSHTKDHEPASQLLSLQIATILIAISMFGSISFVTKFENKNPETSDDRTARIGSVNPSDHHSSYYDNLQS